MRSGLAVGAIGVGVANACAGVVSGGKAVSVLCGVGGMDVAVGEMAVAVAAGKVVGDATGVGAVTAVGVSVAWGMGDAAVVGGG